MIKTIIKESISKIKKQINILETILNQEHKSGIDVQEALNALKEGLGALEKVKNTPSPAGRKKTVDAELIKKLRSEGKTQEQVARELNISTSTVRRNE